MGKTSEENFVMRIIVFAVVAFSAAGLLSATAQQPALITPAQAEARDNLQSYVSRSKLMLVAPIEIGQLNEGDEQQFIMETPAGVRLSIRGACDDGCDDIDLEVFDADGHELGADIEDDGVPSVTLKPTDQPTKLAIKLIMNSCFRAACGIAVGIYKSQ